VAADPLWRQLDQAFRQVKGVAGRTVARMMAEMPEVGTLSHKAIGKLAGLAPVAQDCGRTAGKHSVRGASTPIRAILFTVAEIVRTTLSPSTAASPRPASQKKVIRVALAHKLLTRPNVKAHDVRRHLVILA
jgi:transposase